jgi:hypothetical protein
MDIIDVEVKKTLPIFKVLALPEKDIAEQVKKLKDVLLMDVAAEAYAEKGHMFDDVEFSKDEIEDFLLDNYEKEELEQIAERVAGDVVAEYFMKITKDVPEEKRFEINQIIKSKF